MPRVKLDQELDRVRSSISLMTDLAATQTEESVYAFVRKDQSLAAKVIAKDSEVNAHYTDIKERCVQTIALQQPVARDLRFLSVAMDVASNLERIGDYAADNARLVAYLPRPLTEEEGKTLLGMGKLAKRITQLAGKTFTGTEKSVEDVSKLENEIDSLYAKSFEDVSKLVADDPKLAFNYLLAARHLERMGDHAVNIVTRTLYVITGKEEYI